jgi:hypothetical protein
MTIKKPASTPETLANDHASVHDAATSLEPEQALDLRVVVGALVVLLILVGLMVWLVPSTLGAGTVNITIRQ